MKGDWILKNVILILLFILCFLQFIPSIAETPADIVEKAENLYKGSSSYGTFTMNVVTPDYKRTVQMEAWNVGNDKALILIKSPKKEAGNKTLKIKNELWSYLKSTETTMKLPSSMLLQSWNGSDLTNDDLVHEVNLARDYTTTILSSNEKDGTESCWKLQLIPKPTTPVVWGKIYYWIRQSDYIPTKIEYYDEKNTLMRTMTFSDIKVMDKRKIPSKWTIINNKKKGNYTEFIYDDVKFDLKIPEKVFSFRELEK